MTHRSVSALACLLPFLFGTLPLRAGETMADALREFAVDFHVVRESLAMPDPAPGLARVDALCTNWQARLEAVDFAALDASSRVDYLLLRNALLQQVRDDAAMRARLAVRGEATAFRTNLQELVARRRAGAPIGGQEAATRVAALAAQVKTLRGRVQAGLATNTPAATNATPSLAITPLAARRAAGDVDAMRQALDGWFAGYRDSSPELAWWLKQPCEAAAMELEGYAKMLREEAGGLRGREDDALLGEPVGADDLAAALRLEFLACSAAELIAIGERELAWCEAQRASLTRDLGLGDDWRAALAAVKAEHVPPGEQLEYVAAVGREAIAFVRAHSLVTVPPLCEESWSLRMLSPEEQKTVPYASYGGGEVMVAFGSATMPLDERIMAMRGNNRAFTRLTTPHELVPGHHLQSFLAARSQTQRRPFATPFYVEGWALYGEMRLWELGWARTPRERLGMLFWRMHRAARVIVTLNYHLGRMTPDAMTAFLIDRVGHERAGALSEVRRYLEAEPLYQASYLVGGLQLDALRRELVRPGGWSEREFNDAVLAENALPIELLRAVLLRQPLLRDSQPEWRFDSHRLAHTEPAP